MDQATQGLIFGKRYPLLASAASVMLSLGWEVVWTEVRHLSLRRKMQELALQGRTNPQL